MVLVVPVVGDPEFLYRIFFEKGDETRGKLPYFILDNKWETSLFPILEGRANKNNLKSNPERLPLTQLYSAMQKYYHQQNIVKKSLLPRVQPHKRDTCYGTSKVEISNYHEKRGIPRHASSLRNFTVLLCDRLEVIERLKKKLYENKKEAHFYSFGKYQEGHGRKTLGILFNHEEEHC